MRKEVKNRIDWEAISVPGAVPFVSIHREGTKSGCDRKWSFVSLVFEGVQIMS
jgi:hypothetical protein